MTLRNRADDRKRNAGQAVRPLWKRILLRSFLILGFAPFVVWGALSLVFNSGSQPLRVSLAAVYAVASVAALFRLPPKSASLACLCLFAIPLVDFVVARPSHDRSWPPDVAAMPYAEINGDLVALHNVRNCSYTSPTNFTVNYETRTYDLTRLKSVDILFSDWGLKGVAHTMMSFGFEGNDYLCFSIETRKEAGEAYSALKGFFRKYELIYIAADERDAIRVRTNYRQGEDVFLYRIRVPATAQLRNGFLDYMNRINQLHDRAEWYNAVTDNCMTSGFRIIRKHAAEGRADWHWSVILNGYAPAHAYKTGALDTSFPFDELKRRSRINDRAQAAGDAPDFSVKIREGMPGMDWTTK